MDLIEKILQKGNSENENEVISPLDTVIAKSHALSYSNNKNSGLHAKDLLGKLEELENENNGLNLKYNEVVQEKESMKNKINDLLAELKKKDEERSLLLQEREDVQEKVILTYLNFLDILNYIS